MTTEHTPSHIVHLATSEEALAIINRCRKEVDENFEVRPLDVEFPAYATQLGLAGLFLAEADNNVTGTFKWRGARVATEMLYRAGWRSLVAYSAGNHSLGAAAAVREYEDMFLDVFIPESAPQTKQEGPRKLMTDDRLAMHIGGRTLSDAAQLAAQWQEAHPISTSLPPFDNPNVIRGQGTIIDDILSRLPDVEVIVGPTGGGGLAAGNLQRLEELGRTDIQYYAAQATGSNSMSQSLARRERVQAENPNPLFGGAAAQLIGQHVFEICRRMENFHTVTVTDEEVEELADQYIYDHGALLRTSEPKEPTTLLGIAALRQVAQRHPNAVIAAISTGHNASLHLQQPPTRLTTKVWSGTFPK